MIRYSLVCERNHAFESWFANSDAYDRQVRRGLVTCPVCNSAKVDKALMAPSLTRSERSRPKRRNVGPVPEPDTLPSAAAPEPEKNPVAIVSDPEREVRAKLKELRDQLVKNSDYVGEKFPDEARAMHYGDIEHRSIYGEASPDEAKALHEEGIEFHPLPRLPDERN